MKKTILLLFLLILATGCAHNIPIEISEEVYTFGFFGGLWHGFISSIAFIISLFNDDVAIYAINNNGNWYNFGFIVGICFGYGSLSSSDRK